MSGTITLKNTMARDIGVPLNIFQHLLMIAVLFVVFGIITFSLKNPPSIEGLKSAYPVLPQFAELSGLTVFSENDAMADKPVAEQAVVDAPEAVVLSPRMQGALGYVKRRYKVSPEALVPVFEVAQLIGKEMRIDPLLIVAIIGIESGFNPFAESAMGARGLMQVIPRFHRDKVPEGAGDSSLLDPLINIRVGVQVLDEAIRRRGGLVAGLQHYAGSSEPEGSYASKVLAEKERLEQASRRNLVVANASA
jgi:soluble lytic murein transglycosylase-like protein